MIAIRNLVYSHANREPLFKDLNLTITPGQKIGLAGNNGSGKSTLLKLIAGALEPTAGVIDISKAAYYIPQHFGQFNGQAVSAALGIHEKLHALHQILQGDVTQENFDLLADDWTIGDRAKKALADWNLSVADLDLPMEVLSGGQKTRAFLAGVALHNPSIVLLDEPTNHLDESGREALYAMIQESRKTLLIVSHDPALLNLMDSIAELTSAGIRLYGGSYDFFREQKLLENNALIDSIQAKEKMLRATKQAARDNAERQQRLDARGRKKQEKAGLPTILMNTLRNKAENSTAKLKEVHAGKVEEMSAGLADLRAKLPPIDAIRFGFENAAIHAGKELVTADSINISYDGRVLWKEPLTFELRAGERMWVRGKNGAGKTTLIRMLLQLEMPAFGRIRIGSFNAVYVDQEYSLLDNALTVYQQVLQYNDAALLEHEMRIRLVRFLFTEEYLDRRIADLSGGERMRLCICCLTMRKQAPDRILLDEPTNNLDIQNVDILLHALSAYCGTIVLITHDKVFAEQVGIAKEIVLSRF